MGFFKNVKGLFETKQQSAFQHTIQVLGGSSEFIFDKDTATVKKAYWMNGDVYSITSRIARLAADIPRLIFEDKNGELIPVLDGDLFDLINRKYSDSQTAISGRQESITNLLTRGNSFIYERVIPGFNNIELVILRNTNTVVTCGIEGFQLVPTKYTYTIGGKSTGFDPETIIHTKYYNPSPDYENTCLGLSPLEAGMMSLLFSSDIKKAQANLIKTQGGRGFLTNRSAGVLSEGDKKVIQNVQDTRIEGAKNFNKLWATSANIDFVSTAMNAQQLKTLESAILAKRDLCDVFGVDSSLFNDPENKTYNNRVEAEKAMFNNAVIPVNQMDIESLNESVVKKFSERDGKKYIIKQDLTGLPVLHKDETEKSKKAKNESAVIVQILTSEISNTAKLLSLQRTLGISEAEAQNYVGDAE